MGEHQGLPADRQAEYGVVVVGGGTTGCCAALAAARQGVRVALLEREGFLGGTAACGLPWMAFVDVHGRPFVGGIPLEILERLRSLGGASAFHRDPICSSTVWVDGTLLKVVLSAMMEEAGVDVYLHAVCAEVCKEGGRVAGVVALGAGGFLRLNAGVVIDSTDSGCVAALAGVPYTRGREADGRVQAASTVIIVGNLDVAEMIAYFTAHPRQMRPFNIPEDALAELVSRLPTAPCIVLGAFEQRIAEASRAGFHFPRDRMIGVVFPARQEMVCVASRVEDADVTDFVRHSAAERTGYAQIPEILAFIRDWMPGGSQAQLVSSGHTLGIRESRHTACERMLTGEDLLAGRVFEDTVAMGCYHIDIHSPDGKGLEPLTQPPPYGIPYRCLVPQGVDGLLVAGRCLGADHRAEAAVRVIPILGAIGQAAGTAAGLSALRGQAPRDLSGVELRNLLRDQGAIVDAPGL